MQPSRPGKKGESSRCRVQDGEAMQKRNDAMWSGLIRAAMPLILTASAAMFPAGLAQARQSNEPEQAGPYGSLLIKDVTVIDGSGGPAFGPADVFIKGNRIVRVALADAISREESNIATSHEPKPPAPDRVIE